MPEYFDCYCHPSELLLFPLQVVSTLYPSLPHFANSRKENSAIDRKWRIV